MREDVSDFYAWTREQAAALRAVRPARVDWERIAEALDEMGDSELGALESDLARVIEYLLKLQYSPASDPRNGWVLSVVEHRADRLGLSAQRHARAQAAGSSAACLEPRPQDRGDEPGTVRRHRPRGTPGCVPLQPGRNPIRRLVSDHHSYQPQLGREGDELGRAIAVSRRTFP